MLTTSTTNTRAILPDAVAGLVVQPSLNLAVAGNPLVSTIVPTDSHVLRIPAVTADPSAAWVAEGAEIPATDATIAELDVVPSKLAGLSIITAELADDSNPQAAELIGMGLARDLSRKIDAAWFGNLTAPAPTGLAGLSGVQTVVAADAFANTDAFSTAISLAETVGATVTAFVMGPTTALAMAKVRDAAGSNRPLLGADGTMASQRMVRGVPILVSAAVGPNTCWALDASRCLMVVRQDAEIIADRSVFFTSHRVAVRAIMRAGFGFVHAASVVKITTA